MVASKGYGKPLPDRNGVGVFSDNSGKNPAPVPKKGSQLNMKHKLMDGDHAKAEMMAKKQMKQEDTRGRWG